MFTSILPLHLLAVTLIYRKENSLLFYSTVLLLQAACAIRINGFAYGLTYCGLDVQKFSMYSTLTVLPNFIVIWLEKVCKLSEHDKGISILYTPQNHPSLVFDIHVSLMNVRICNLRIKTANFKFNSRETNFHLLV
jgi:hypothetical protein